MKILLKYSLLWLIVCVALVFRLYRIHYPLIDWHSFRQADTASVTREYVKNGIDLLEPEYHDLSNIQSGKDNLEGYRMVEFPIINAFTAAIIKLFPVLPLVPTSRFISILFSLGTLVSLFFLTHILSGKRVAYLTALTFALLPYSVYYSRAILPEAPLLFFTTFSLYLFVKAQQSKKINLLLLLGSVVSFTLALLLKPFAIFIAPVFVVFAVQLYGKNVWKQWPLYLFLLTPLPLLAWRNWILHFPTGIPASDWLLNGNSIRLRPAWFRWLGYERFTKMMLGYVGIIFIPFTLYKVSKEMLLMLSWWLGILAYFIVIATGNVQHDYYQVLALPIVCITIGYGVLRFYQFFSDLKFLPASKDTRHLLALTLSVVLYAGMIVGGFQQVKGFFNVNNWEYSEAGKRVDELVPADALVIAPAFGDTSFLFQTNRRGWPIGFEIEDKIKKGATHYVSTSYDDEARELEKKYFIIEKNQKYIIIDLTKQRPQ